MILSVVIITHNEEANIGRTLASVSPLVAGGEGEMIVVDSGSTDGTAEIAKSLGANVFVEVWKGYSAQKNSAIDKASGQWILSLDADEELEPGLSDEILKVVQSGRALNAVDQAPSPVSSSASSYSSQQTSGFWIPRKNFFLGRWMKYGGYWPDRKLRLFQRGAVRFEDRLVHEDAKMAEGATGNLRGSLLHHSYPHLADYIDHMNRYSSLGAEMVAAKGGGEFRVAHVVVNPIATFIYNYFFRLGFLDGREGLLLHLYHSVYVSWKYAKAWERSRANRPEQAA